MTSEAHKRNPPGSERWGKKNNMRPVNETEMVAMRECGIGAPDVIEHAGAYYVDADQYALWRSAPPPHQAGDSQSG